VLSGSLDLGGGASETLKMKRRSTVRNKKHTTPRDIYTLGL
jgi:hypothetical protein